MATILPFPVRPAPANVAHSAEEAFVDCILAKLAESRPGHPYDRLDVRNRILAIVQRLEVAP